MELHTEDRVLDMGEAHDLALLGPGSDLQALGQRTPPNEKRVVTGRLEGNR